jgi:hypothetical protein
MEWQVVNDPHRSFSLGEKAQGRSMFRVYPISEVGYFMEVGHLTLEDTASVIFREPQCRPCEITVLVPVKKYDILGANARQY